MNQEQDQEKLMQAASQVFSNSLNGVASLASIGQKPKTIIEVKSAKDDLHNTRLSLREGVSIDQISQTLFNSPVAQEIKRIGKDSSEYVNSIVRKAKIQNKLETRSNREQTRQRTRNRQLER